MTEPQYQSPTNADPMFGGPIAGEILGDELDARNWSHTEFAARLGLSYPFVADIVAGKVRIGPTLAKQLAGQLRTSAELWENLQAADDERAGRVLSGDNTGDPR